MTSEERAERLVTGPKIEAFAPESNNGKIFIHVDGEEAVLVPGTNFRTFGYGIVVVCERGGDGCHVTVG